MTYALLQAKKTAELRAELGKPVRVTLPWPPKELSPNARIHWGDLAPIKKQHKNLCWGLFLQQRAALKGKAAFTVTFCPPDRRHRDRDNCISLTKTLQDALSIVTGINDRHFVMTYAFGEPVKGGAVIVEVAA